MEPVKSGPDPGSSIFQYLWKKPIEMKRSFFRLLSKINKKVLPSYSKRQLDLQKATKLQMAIIGWRLWVTKKALDQ